MDDKELSEFIEMVLAQNPELLESLLNEEEIPEESHDINNVPALVPNDQGNYLRPTIEPNRYGVAGPVGDLSGYANVGMDGLKPLDVAAGISGNRGDLNVNIPLDDPGRFNLSAETEIAGNILSAGMTPMEKALFLNIGRRF